jgi:hypothetical protein
MKKLLKIAAILIVVLLLIVGIGVGIFFYKINSLAKRGIEEGGTYALGVPTTVDSVFVRLFAGESSLSGLDVANPPGFASTHFVSLKKGSIAVTLSSLDKDIVEVPRLELSGIDVNLQRSPSGSNYGAIIDNLSKFKSASSHTTGQGKKFVIRELTIRDISIHADMLGAPGQVGAVVNSAAKVELPIESIQLKDVGRTAAGDTGVTMSELSSILMQAVLAAAAEKGYGTIPGEIMNDLKGAVSSFDGLKNLPVAIIGRTGETATMLGGDIEKLGEGAGKAINDLGKGITDGIGGLLGGNKDKQDDKKAPPKKP